MKKAQSLRFLFLKRVLIALIALVLVTSTIQLFFIKEQIENNVQKQAGIVAQNVVNTIDETEAATQAIEHQIDLKMVGYAKYIGFELKGKTVNDITNDDLQRIADELQIQGITIFAPENGDIVGVKSTDPKEIGFSFGKVGGLALKNMQTVLNGGTPSGDSMAYVGQGIAITPISQSGSHNEQPEFFKYAYYHEPGTDFIINPFIEDNQIYQFTQTVGPNQEILNMLKTNKDVKEIAVLNPKVFTNPSLEKVLYNPQKKVQFGTFYYKNDHDIQLIKSEANHLKKVTMVEKIKGKKYYQMFIPSQNGRLIYLAFDYHQMTLPLFHHSFVLIVMGLFSLVILFLLTARFFNRIYETIQIIKAQMKRLETGDLTAKSVVKDQSELGRLSTSANTMADQLNQLLRETQTQALKTQRLSVMLEKEASESIDRMYHISTESTMKSREQLYEIMEFIEEVERILQSYQDQETVKQVLGNIDRMREVANERTMATTDMTMTLSDLLKSLHGQSSELSDISKTLLQYMEKFKL